MEKHSNNSRENWRVVGRHSSTSSNWRNGLGVNGCAENMHNAEMFGDRGTDITRSATKITNIEDIEAIEKPQIITSETEISCSAFYYLLCQFFPK